MEDIEDLRFEYMVSGGAWQTTWNSEDHAGQLPELVQITVTMNDARGVSYPFTTRIFLPRSTDNP